MTRMFTRHLPLAAFAAFSIFALEAGPAIAQSDGGEPQGDWRISVGAAGLYAPMFEGADDYAFSVMPDVRVTYRDRFFASVPEGAGYNLVTRGRGEDGWKAGPLARYKFGRDEDGESTFALGGDTDALRGMGDVDGTVELGGFADYAYGPLQARAELLQGLGGHEAAVLDAEITYNGNYGPVRYAFGPRANWATGDYHKTYFGIDSAQSVRTGLATYDPDGGLVSYGIGASAMMPLTKDLSLVTFAGYDRFGEEVTDSPLISERGAEDQVQGGIGLSYTFGFSH